jgi:glyoxylase-like metal-dependent hydrolase (beta-lactamase superfamily II)
MQLKQALLATAAAAAIALSGAAQPAAPMARTQAPGYYRMMLGDFEITALSDGTAAFPMGKMLTHVAPAAVQRAFTRAFLKDPVEISVNAFLVNTGTKLVLVDTGTAGLFGPTLGKLADNLKAAGYQPGQVDEIYITHMHADHVGGLAAGGERAFPNAVVRADRRDADFWLNPASADKAPKEVQGMIQSAIAAFAPYVAAGKFQPFDGDTALVPGVRAVASHGHTPGHTTYLVESKGETLALLGDLVHVAAVQFADPAATIQFDSDATAAAAQRRKAFADAAKKGYWIGAAHIAFPGIGHVRAEGKGYAFVPAAYSVPR